MSFDFAQILSVHISVTPQHNAIHLCCQSFGAYDYGVVDPSRLRRWKLSLTSSEKRDYVSGIFLAGGAKLWHWSL